MNLLFHENPCCVFLMDCAVAYAIYFASYRKVFYALSPPHGLTR
ncbi:hypothetical protein SXCC_02795 [Gluconacetobacter sp. SXCC-1]|nr:hypothetical protein SXCC_02795 [Gluconacetobacter sp. SXCC-1]